MIEQNKPAKLIACSTKYQIQIHYHHKKSNRKNYLTVTIAEYSKKNVFGLTRSIYHRLAFTGHVLFTRKKNYLICSNAKNSTKTRCDQWDVIFGMIRRRKPSITSLYVVGICVCALYRCVFCMYVYKMLWHRSSCRMMNSFESMNIKKRIIQRITAFVRVQTSCDWWGTERVYRVSVYSCIYRNDRRLTATLVSWYPQPFTHTHESVESYLPRILLASTAHYLSVWIHCVRILVLSRNQLKKLLNRTACSFIYNIA